MSCSATVAVRAMAADPRRSLQLNAGALRSLRAITHTLTQCNTGPLRRGNSLKSAKKTAHCEDDGRKDFAVTCTQQIGPSRPKSPRRRPQLLPSLLLLCCYTGFRTAATMLQGTQKLDAIIAEATRDPYNELTRFVFSVASSDEDCIYSGKGGYGQLPTTPVDNATLEKEGEPITEDSIFELYSCTKLPATVAALQLIEQGKLDLDDEIQKYLPEAADVKVLEGFNEDGSLKLADAERPITVRMLLTHTSGEHFHSPPSLVLHAHIHTTGSTYAMIDGEILKAAKELGLPGDFYTETATKVRRRNKWRIAQC